MVLSKLITCAYLKRFSQVSYQILNRIRFKKFNKLKKMIGLKLMKMNKYFFHHLNFFISHSKVFKNSFNSFSGQYLFQSILLS